jgi:hypothetical protein
MNDALHSFGRHSHVILAGIREISEMDARQVQAGMTICRMLNLYFSPTPWF